MRDRYDTPAPTFKPIPSERALVPTRRRRSHWVPVSEQGRSFDWESLRRLGRMVAPVIGRWLGLPRVALDELDKVAINEVVQRRGFFGKDKSK